MRAAVEKTVLLAERAARSVEEVRWASGCPSRLLPWCRGSSACTREACQRLHVASSACVCVLGRHVTPTSWLFPRCPRGCFLAAHAAASSLPTPHKSHTGVPHTQHASHGAAAHAGGTGRPRCSGTGAGLQRAPAGVRWGRGGRRRTPKPAPQPPDPVSKQHTKQQQQQPAPGGDHNRPNLQGNVCDCPPVCSLPCRARRTATCVHRHAQERAGAGGAPVQ